LKDLSKIIPFFLVVVKFESLLNLSRISGRLPRFDSNFTTTGPSFYKGDTRTLVFHLQKRLVDRKIMHIERYLLKKIIFVM